MRVIRSRAVAAAVAGVAVAGATIVAGTPAAQASPRNDFEMPFPCGQVWQGMTYPGHSPKGAIDFNYGSGNDDLGKPVVASAAGKVTETILTDSSGHYTSYGKYIRIDHGGGWVTYYAHLNDFAVKNGATVQQGQLIGHVGHTGNAVTAHLHYEQRLNGVLQPFWFHNAPMSPGLTEPASGNGPTYTSRNCGTRSTVVDTGVSAVIGAHGTETAFTRSSTGRLATNVSKADGSWAGWVNRDAAVLGSGPDATSRTAGSYDVVARRTDGTVIIKSKTNTGWGSWRVLADGLTTNYAPAIVTYDTTTIYVFAVRATDGALMSTRWHQGNGYGPWRPAGDNTRLTSGPDAVKINSDTIAVAFRGAAGNIRIARWTSGRGWSAAANWGAPAPGTKAGVAPAIASRAANSIDLMVSDRNGVLHRKINRARAGWTTTGLPKISQGPDLVGTADGQLRLFARNTANTPVTAGWTAGKGWTAFHRL